MMTVSVCLSVCLSVCDHISGTTHPIFTKFFLCMLPVTVARSSSGGVAIRYVLPVLWTTSYFFFRCVCRAMWRWRRASTRNRLRGSQSSAGRMPSALSRYRPTPSATYSTTSNRTRPSGKRFVPFTIDSFQLFGYADCPLWFQ